MKTFDAVRVATFMRSPMPSGSKRRCSPDSNSIRAPPGKQLDDEELDLLGLAVGEASDLGLVADDGLVPPAAAVPVATGFFGAAEPAVAPGSPAGAAADPPLVRDPASAVTFSSALHGAATTASLFRSISVQQLI
jgi:hypothetical protein